MRIVRYPVDHSVKEAIMQYEAITEKSSQVRIESTTRWASGFWSRYTR
jgi:hypothetical protein